MNKLQDRPDDDLLSAWLDGELNPTTQQQVSTWLNEHPEDAARVNAWAADREALRAQLDTTLAEPLPAAWTQRLQREAAAANAPQWRRAAWVAGLMLASGLTGAWVQKHTGTDLATLQASASAQGAAPWLQRAAAAHAVYVPEQRHPVEVNVHEGDASQQRAQEQHLAKWLTKRLSFPVQLFDLQAQGFALVGGRLLPDASAPGAQLMYQRADGQRVTVYLRKADGPTPVAFRYEQVQGLSMFYWIDHGAGCAMVGSLPREQMLAVAEAVYEQTEREGGSAPH
jgi:anti-sigma factor RsiW